MNDIFEYVEKHSMRINSQFRPEDPKKKKKKNMEEKQKNMAQNLFPNEWKAIIQPVKVKAKVKAQVPKNRP